MEAKQKGKMVLTVTYIFVWPSSRTMFTQSRYNADFAVYDD